MNQKNPTNKNLDYYLSLPYTIQLTPEKMATGLQKSCY